MSCAKGSHLVVDWVVEASPEAGFLGLISLLREIGFVCGEKVPKHRCCCARNSGVSEGEEGK